MTDATTALAGHLAKLKALRGSRSELPPRLAELKAWQARRLSATYADLSSEPRYQLATEFFLEDLYGPKDFSQRDDAMIRILPVLARTLPAAGLETATLAIELEALSEDLDQRVARALPAGAIDDASYAKAYREAGTPAERGHQIDLMIAVGQRLDSLVTRPFVFGMLKLMRQPARMAGLADLQDFLERGFQSFRAMGGSREFLETIEERERGIAKAIFSGEPRAFSERRKASRRRT